MECKIKINGDDHTVQSGKRLVNTIKELGYDISHRCGGNAKCTTCQVLPDGATGLMTETEKQLFKNANIQGTRLACQMLTRDGLDVDILMPVSEMEWDEPGPDPKPYIQPEPIFAEEDH